MAGAREVFRRTAEFHEHRGLVDQLACHGAHDVNAQHLVGLRICQNLDEAIGRLVGLGAAIGEEQELAGLVVDTGRLQLFLRLAHGGDFRRGIDHAGDHTVIHMARLSREDFRECDAFIFRLVGEHRPFDDVADGIDAGNSGGVVMIDLDAPARVLLNAHRFEAQALSVGHAAHRHEHDIRLDLLRSAARGRFNREGHIVLGGGSTHHL